jgi:hypothetical protein
MSDSDLKLLTDHFERLRRECDSPGKAIAQLQSEGLLDQSGRTAAQYRESDVEEVCR